MSREPSYYEIALTQRQVVIAFVILLTCLVAAFFSGVWVGTGGRGSQAGERIAARQEGGGGGSVGLPQNGFSTRPAAGTEAVGAPPSSAGGTGGDDSNPGEHTDRGDDAESLRFFSEEGAAAPAARMPAPSPAQTSSGPSSATEPEPDAGAVSGPATGSGSDRRVHANPNDPRRRSNVATPVRPLPQAPEPVDPRDTAPPGAGGPVIQVFSSHDQAQAQAVLDRLLLADLDAYLSPADVRGVIHYRVRLGPFRDREQAEAVARQLRDDFQLETWITR